MSNKKSLLIISLFFLFSSQVYADMISETFKHSRVYDTNQDDKINCVDYTICFKRTYDSLTEPYNTYNCEIVRNEKLEHLFIRIRKDYDSPWIYLEPQGTAKRYLMEEIWGDQYYISANVYGETWLWLNGVYK
ncbi:MAG: hypothetical protein K6D95_03730 [Treponema sp.]|nr:hypothetical protein [Treponema sp.]